MNINTEIHNAFEVIQNGGIILYPTHTVWGVGCDATNEEAIKKIYALKQRDDSKSMSVLMNGDKMMYNVFKEIPDVAWQILDLSEKPTTLILDNPRNVAQNLIATDKTLGVRIVKEPFCFKLMERMKKPLVSTSANISGMFAQLERGRELLDKIAYVASKVPLTDAAAVLAVFGFTDLHTTEYPAYTGVKPKGKDGGGSQPQDLVGTGLAAIEVLPRTQTGTSGSRGALFDGRFSLTETCVSIDMVRETFTPLASKVESRSPEA